ncbi:hypothetical protein CLV78_11410 [Aliiruegeria haliotis]|uniref:Uncharacterized protein n=1 Tax=Aliiruegeria haliotis TaxID=1280846 RepID=A0A2T0RGD6_9RHOB|nr:hypothetical protein CLV78_11410 [Aliiruegeria haliotis]
MQQANIEVGPFDLAIARARAIDAEFPSQLRGRSLRTLYCCSDGVRGRGAAMTYLSHRVSFHSKERIAPPKPGIKHLGLKNDVWFS